MPDAYIWKNLSLHLIFNLKEELIKKEVIKYPIHVTAAVEVQVDAISNCLG